jgi:hypothetical protein
MTAHDLIDSTAPHGRQSRLVSRAPRRGLVAALVAGCALLVLLGLLGARTALAFVLIGLLLAADVLLLAVTSQVAELPEGAVDERQEATRNRAYRLAYRVVMHALIWPIGLVVALVAFGDPFGWLAALWANTALVIALGTAAAQLLGFLPTMILAWTEPEPIEAE